MRKAIPVAMAVGALAAAAALGAPALTSTASGADQAPAAGATPLWVKHVQNYTGGISNGARQALAQGDAAKAKSSTAAAAADPNATEAGGLRVGVPLNNVEMNRDSTPPVPQNETTVAQSLDDPLVAIAAANDYVADDIMIMRTRDGGRNWNTYQQTPVFFPTRDACTGSDPILQYSKRDRAFYLATLCFFRSQAFSEVQIWKSVDDGATWTPSRLASVAATNYNRNTGAVNDNIFLDKEDMVIDNFPGSPHYGRIYVTYTKFHVLLGSGFSDYCPIQLSYTDEIPTLAPSSARWEHTAVVPDKPGDNGEGPTANQHSHPQVNENGDLGISYVLEDCNTGLDRHLDYKFSTNGGRTVSNVIQIDHPGEFQDNPDLSDLLPNKPFRAPISPALDYNAKTNTLGYVYQNNVNRERSGADVSINTSTDFGRTWSHQRFVSVNDNGGPARNDQYFPWIDSDEAGNFFVIFYDNRLDPQNHLMNTFQAVSTDNGQTFSNYKISSQSWDPDKAFFTSGAFIGDYNGLSASNRAVYPVWTDGRNSAFERTGLGETDIFTNVELR